MVQLKCQHQMAVQKQSVLVLKSLHCAFLNTHTMQFTFFFFRSQIKFYPENSDSSRWPSDMNEENDLPLRNIPFLRPKVKTNVQKETGDMITDDVDHLEERPRRSGGTEHFTGLLPLDIRKRNDYERRSKVIKRYRLGLYDCISSYCGETEGEKRLSCISFYCHRAWNLYA